MIRKMAALLLAAQLAVPAPVVRADEVVTLAAVKDATLRQAAPTTNDGASVILRTLSELAANLRALVQFDLSAIDPTAAVKTSRLRATVGTAPPQSRNVEVRAVTGSPDWTEGGVTWDSRDGATNWTSAGGDFNPAADTQATGTTSGATVTWNVRSDGTVANIPQGWLDGSFLNRGLLLKDSTEDNPTRAVLNKVLSGSVTMCNTGALCSTVVTFPGGQSVDTTKSFLIFQVRANPAPIRQGAFLILGRISSSTTVTFERNSNEVSAVDVQWYVVEFSQGVVVERGITNQTAATVNQAITSVPGVALAQMFVLTSKRPNPGETNWNNSMPAAADLTSATNLRFRVGSVPGVPHVNAWEVVKFLNPADVLVQRGNITTMVNATTTVNASIAVPVRPDRSIATLTFQGAAGGGTSFGGADIGGRLLDSQLTNCTGVPPTCDTLTIQRTLGSGDDFANIHAQVIEFRTGATVQSGTFNFPPAPSPGQFSQSAGITPVDTSRAFVHSSSHVGGQNSGRTDYSANQSSAAADFVFTLTPSGTANTVTGLRNNGTATSVVNWFVAEMNNDSGSTGRFASREDSLPANRPQLDVSILRDPVVNSLTPGISEVTIDFSFPLGSTALNYDGVIIARRAGGAPTFVPADGTSYMAGDQPVMGEFVAANTSSFSSMPVVILDENGPDNVILPGTSYTYRLYTHDGTAISGAASVAPPHYSFGVNSSTMTLSPSGTSKSWSYKTAAAALSPPGVLAGSEVLVGSNDNLLHGMSAANGGRVYQPGVGIGTTGGAIASRPAVIPQALLTNMDCDPAPGVQPCDAVFVGAGDGMVYAFHAGTGAQIWSQTVALPGGSIQGGGAVHLKIVAGSGLPHPNDVVYFGTRNTGGGSTTNNSVVALDATTGAVLATYAPGNLDIITSTPMLNYADNTLWITSLSNGSTQPSLRQIQFTGAAFTELQTFNLGDISSSPVLGYNSKIIYALGDNGALHAVRSDITCAVSSLATGEAGVGMPSSAFISSTSEDVYFATASALHKFNMTFSASSCTSGQAGTLTDLNGGTWNNPSVTGPSGIVLLPTPLVSVSRLYVGDSTGRLRRFDASTGVQVDVRDVNLSAVIGEPSIDIFLNLLLVGDSAGRIYSYTIF
jgi:hypothetical protein